MVAGSELSIGHAPSRGSDLRSVKQVFEGAQGVGRLTKVSESRSVGIAVPAALIRVMAGLGAAIHEDC